MSFRDELLNHLESQPLFQGRYKNIKCISYDPITKKFKGNFSLIFRAIDNIENESVAIKFYAPEDKDLFDVYRIKTFEREPEILKNVLGKKRCLQLLQGLTDYNIPATTTTSSISLPYRYFIIQWLDKEIDEYFEKQEDYEPIDKLLLFNDIISAIEAIHSCGVYHRDLKPDNFREYENKSQRIICAIDYGTAVRYDTPPIVTPTYDYQPGHRWYSAPEALCGLAGKRSIAKFTDYYALGCMLFELFNTEYLGLNLLNNPQFQRACAYMTHKIYHLSNDDDKHRIWNQEIIRVKKSVIIPSITQFSTTAPKSIDDLLDKIIKRLVSFDYNDRVNNLEIIRQNIFTCIKVLKNIKYEHYKLELKRQRKLNHQKRLAESEKKLMISLRQDNKEK